MIFRADKLVQLNTISYQPDLPFVNMHRTPVP